MSFDGSLIAEANSSDYVVRVRNHYIPSIIPLASLSCKGHTGMIGSIGWAPDSKRVISASEDGTARVWDVQGDFANWVYGCPTVFVLAGHTGPVFSAVFSPDGNYIATCSADDTIRIWDAKTGNQIRIIRSSVSIKGEVKNRITYAHQCTDYTITWSPDSRHVTTSVQGGTRVHVWDAQTGDLVRTFAYDVGGRCGTAAFLPTENSILIEVSGTVSKFTLMMANQDRFSLQQKLLMLRAAKNIPFTKRDVVCLQALYKPLVASAKAWLDEHTKSVFVGAWQTLLHMTGLRR